MSAKKKLFAKNIFIVLTLILYMAVSHVKAFGAYLYSDFSFIYEKDENKREKILSESSSKLTQIYRLRHYASIVSPRIMPLETSFEYKKSKQSSLFADNDRELYLDYKLHTEILPLSRFPIIANFNRFSSEDPDVSSSISETDSYGFLWLWRLKRLPKVKLSYRIRKYNQANRSSDKSSFGIFLSKGARFIIGKTKYNISYRGDGSGGSERSTNVGNYINFSSHTIFSRKTNFSQGIRYATRESSGSSDRENNLGRSQQLNYNGSFISKPTEYLSNKFIYQFDTDSLHTTKRQGYYLVNVVGYSLSTKVSVSNNVSYQTSSNEKDGDTVSEFIGYGTSFGANVLHSKKTISNYRMFYRLRDNYPGSTLNGQTHYESFGISGGVTRFLHKKWINGGGNYSFVYENSDNKRKRFSQSVNLNASIRRLKHIDVSSDYGYANGNLDELKNQKMSTRVNNSQTSASNYSVSISNNMKKYLSLTGSYRYAESTDYETQSIVFDCFDGATTTSDISTTDFCDTANPLKGSQVLNLSGTSHISSKSYGLSGSTNLFKAIKLATSYRKSSSYSSTGDDSGIVSYRGNVSHSRVFLKGMFFVSAGFITHITDTITTNLNGKFRPQNETIRKNFRMKYNKRLIYSLMMFLKYYSVETEEKKGGLAFSELTEYYSCTLRMRLGAWYASAKYSYDVDVTDKREESRIYLFLTRSFAIGL